MVLYKVWLETRWRFLIGAGLLVLGALSCVMTYPQLARLLPDVATLTSKLPLDGVLADRVAEAIAMSKSYRGYIAGQWFGKNMPQLWIFFAVLLGTGGLISRDGGGTSFTLSLPVSRRRWLYARAALGGAELLALALVPALLIPLFSPAIHESYALTDALIHGITLFVAGSVFFALTLWLSTTLSGIWPPMLIAICIALGLSVIDQLVRPAPALSPISTMAGLSYFRGDGVPWAGLLASVAASALLLHAAAKTLAGRDF